jgi:hypothetical protein
MWENYRLWRMKRYLQNLTRSMKRNQQKSLGIIVLGCELDETIAAAAFGCLMCDCGEAG